jgi:hypothetical protein
MFYQNRIGGMVLVRARGSIDHNQPPMDSRGTPRAVRAQVIEGGSGTMSPGGKVYRLLDNHKE